MRTLPWALNAKVTGSGKALGARGTPAGCPLCPGRVEGVLRSDPRAAACAAVKQVGPGSPWGPRGAHSPRPGRTPVTGDLCAGNVSPRAASTSERRGRDTTRTTGVPYAAGGRWVGGPQRCCRRGLQGPRHGGSPSHQTGLRKSGEGARATQRSRVSVRVGTAGPRDRGHPDAWFPPCLLPAWLPLRQHSRGGGLPANPEPLRLPPEQVRLFQVLRLLLREVTGLFWNLSL